MYIFIWARGWCWLGSHRKAEPHSVYDGVCCVRVCVCMYVCVCVCVWVGVWVWVCVCVGGWVWVGVGVGVGMGGWYVCVHCTCTICIANSVYCTLNGGSACTELCIAQYRNTICLKEWMLLNSD